MGWTFTRRPKGQSTKDFFTNHLCGDGDISRLELIDISASWTVAYAAFRRTIKATGQSYVFGCVILIKHVPKDEYNFGYKDMDESMGPYYTDCPERILKLLTPLEEIQKIHQMHETSNEYAKKWRDACWANITKSKAVAKIKHGAVIRFANQLKFTDGHMTDRFRVSTIIWKGRSKRTFISMDNGAMYRISRWKQREYTVETA